MRRLLLLGFCCWGLMQVPAFAVEAVSKNIDETIRQANTDLAIKEINKTPMPGIYELRVNNQVFYSEKTGRYIIAGGHLYDTNTKKDLTAARLEVINKIDWKDLPLDKAIVSGDPKGEKIAIFSDPDCHFCKLLEEKLEHAKGLRIYTFLFPLEKLHPKARGRAESIWCAKDQHKALQDVMLHKVKLPKADCETPIDEIQNLAARFSINGTPTLISEDGRKRSGAASAEAILKWAKNE